MRELLKKMRTKSDKNKRFPRLARANWPIKVETLGEKAVDSDNYVVFPKR
jgi:hypothetical protein